MAAGAECKYHDPYIPSIEVGGSRRDDILKAPRGRAKAKRFQLTSVSINDELLSLIDCVVILTSHPGINYQAVIEPARLVFDAVGVTRERETGNVVRL
jgi:UDP-N-acetyl-D-mannosaminuronate dehydrogenase